MTTILDARLNEMYAIRIHAEHDVCTIVMYIGPSSDNNMHISSIVINRSIQPLTFKLYVNCGNTNMLNNIRSDNRFIIKNTTSISLNIITVFQIEFSLLHDYSVFDKIMIDMHDSGANIHRVLKFLDETVEDYMFVISDLNKTG